MDHSHAHPHPHHHHETHFRSTEVVRDVVIGMADGLTVPFALAAGLTGAVNASRVIVIAGLAEIVAGSIAMGLGGYLAARSDAEHYASERAREEREIIEKPADERREVLENLYEGYGVAREHSGSILKAFEAKPKVWVDWMMRFELGLEEPNPKRALQSAITIAVAYIAGGLIPLAPYMITPEAFIALRYSVGATVLALAIFGYVKGTFTGAPPWRSAIQTTVIGAIAAGAAFSIAKLIS